VPEYVYPRRDGSTFELEQRITVDALVICPTTGQAVERVMQRFSPRDTGAGFYSTDHPKATPSAGRNRSRWPGLTGCAGAGRGSSPKRTSPAENWSKAKASRHVPNTLDGSARERFESSG
jgi:predicted nucleic acid-binding Zn ribbon protein